MFLVLQKHDAREELESDVSIGIHDPTHRPVSELIATGDELDLDVSEEVHLQNPPNLERPDASLANDDVELIELGTATVIGQAQEPIDLALVERTGDEGVAGPDLENFLGVLEPERILEALGHELGTGQIKSGADQLSPGLDLADQVHPNDLPLLVSLSGQLGHVTSGDVSDPGHFSFSTNDL